MNWWVSEIDCVRMVMRVFERKRLTTLIGNFKSQLLQIIAIDIARLASEGQISSKTRRGRLDIGGLVARARRELVIVRVVSRQDGGRSQTREEKTLPELHDARLQSKSHEESQSQKVGETNCL